MFRTVRLSIIRIRTELVPFPSWSCSQAVSKPVWHVPLLCVQWKTPDDGQRNCPKYVEFYSKNKFEKLVHLVGFIIRTFFYQCKIITVVVSKFATILVLSCRSLEQEWADGRRMWRYSFSLTGSKSKVTSCFSCVGFRPTTPSRYSSSAR